MGRAGRVGVCSLRRLDENVFIGIKNRILQGFARRAPGATTLRVWLHRARGVRIGKRAFIGTDTIADPAKRGARLAVAAAGGR